MALDNLPVEDLLGIAKHLIEAALSYSQTAITIDARLAEMALRPQRIDQAIELLRTARKLVEPEYVPASQIADRPGFPT